MINQLNNSKLENLKFYDNDRCYFKTKAELINASDYEKCLLLRSKNSLRFWPILLSNPSKNVLTFMKLINDDKFNEMDALLLKLKNEKSKS